MITSITKKINHDSNKESDTASGDVNMV